jgi:hypothetical protein
MRWHRASAERIGPRSPHSHPQSLHQPPVFQHRLAVEDPDDDVHHNHAGLFGHDSATVAQNFAAPQR